MMSGLAPGAGDKVKRWMLSEEAKKILLEAYAQNNFPSNEVHQRLAQTLKSTTQQVRIWFQNQRARDGRARTDSTCAGQPAPGRNWIVMPVAAVAPSIPASATSCSSSSAATPLLSNALPTMLPVPTNMYSLGSSLPVSTSVAVGASIGRCGAGDSATASKRQRVDDEVHQAAHRACPSGGLCDNSTSAHAPPRSPSNLILATWHATAQVFNFVESYYGAPPHPLLQTLA